MDVVDVVDVEVVPGLGLGFDPLVVVEVEVVGWVPVVVVVEEAGVLAAPGGHDCETFVIGRFTGSGSELGGVPGGTFWNVNCCPPATVITTVHPSADASGSAATPNTVATDPAAMAAMISFLPLNKLAYSSRLRNALPSYDHM